MVPPSLPKPGPTMPELDELLLTPASAAGVAPEEPDDDDGSALVPHAAKSKMTQVETCRSVTRVRASKGAGTCAL